MNKAFDFEKVTCLLLCLLFLTAICECLSFDSVIDCKLERKCQPYLEQRDQMCKNYTIVPKCSHWNVESFNFYSSQLEVVYLDDFTLSEDRDIDISTFTAIYLPQLYYPTRSMVEWCYLYSSKDIYSIFFTDAVNSSFTALYHVKPFTSSFFIEISSLPALGVLYMVLIPRVPTKVTIGLYGSVVPLDFPEVTNNWFKHLLDLFYSSTYTFCWLLYILVFILFIYCCKDIVKKSDTVLSLSTDVVFLIEKLKLHPRTPRFKQGGDHRRYTSMHLDEEWMEPLSLIECQSPEVTVIYQSE